MKSSLLIAIPMAFLMLASNAEAQCLKTKAPVYIAKFSKDGKFEDISSVIKQASDTLEVWVHASSQGEIAYFGIRNGSSHAERLPIKDLPSNTEEIDELSGAQIEMAPLALGADGKKQVAVVFCSTKSFESITEVFSFRNGKWVRDISEKGQDKVYINPGEVFIPIGSQGTGTFYKYQKGRLVKDKDSL